MLDSELLGPATVVICTSDEKVARVPALLTLLVEENEPRATPFPLPLPLPRPDRLRPTGEELPRPLLPELLSVVFGGACGHANVLWSYVVFPFFSHIAHL